MASLTEINSNLFGGIGNAFKTGSVTTMVGWLILAVVICAGMDGEKPRIHRILFGFLGAVMILVGILLFIMKIGGTI